MRYVLKNLSYIMIIVMVVLPVNAEAENITALDYTLMAEQWELSRHGDALTKIPAINNVVALWVKKKQQDIELHYPGGEEGELWVEELRDWMVSLGIPSKFILIVPDSGVEDVIKLRVVRRGDSY